jgi:RNA polymerase sigma-70 factor (ECF subfamily)
MAEHTSSGNPEDPSDRSPCDLAAVLKAARRGEGDAWATLVSLYARRLYAFARSKKLGPDEAEEIAQSVFATVSIKLQSGEYDERGSFEPWLFQIAANRVRDAIRKSKRGASAMNAIRDSADAPGRTVRPEQDDSPTAEPTQTVALRRAMDELPDADREVVELRHRAGMSFKHIAAMLEQPLGTVLARHHRALRKLRDAIESDTNPSTKSDPDEHA